MAGRCDGLLAVSGQPGSFRRSTLQRHRGLNDPCRGREEKEEARKRRSSCLWTLFLAHERDDLLVSKCPASAAPQDAVPPVVVGSSWMKDGTGRVWGEGREVRARMRHA